MSLIKELSIQLYSLREMTATDNGFEKAFKLISDIGYTSVEFAGYGDHSSEEMVALLNKYNLKSMGSHVGPDLLMPDKIDDIIKYSKALGSEYITCPYLPMKNKEDAEKCAEFLKEAGKKVTDAGLKFAYHNHAHEFEKDENGEYLMDVILDIVPPELLSLELDVYWSESAGVDTEAYLKKSGDRITLIHLKQMKDYETKKESDFDEGAIDLKKLSEIALKHNKIDYFVVEHETFDVSEEVSLTKDYNHVMSF